MNKTNFSTQTLKVLPSFHDFSTLIFHFLIMMFFNKLDPIDHNLAMKWLNRGEKT
jgi:hypothetical protein